MPIRLTTYRKGNSIPALPGYTIFQFYGAISCVRINPWV